MRDQMLPRTTASGIRRFIRAKEPGNAKSPKVLKDGCDAHERNAKLADQKLT